MTRTLLSLVSAVVVLAALPGAGRADLSPKVQKKLKGQILFSPEALPQEGDTDSDVVKALKKAAVSELKHSGKSAEGGATWHFNFMAFMNKAPGMPQVSLDFYLDDKTHSFVAQKRLAGIDPKMQMLQTEVDISEDDGLAVGKSYVVKLAAEVHGKDVVLAQAKLRMK